MKRKANQTVRRQNPAVTNQAEKVFLHVARAMEAETLQGQTANRVATATKLLLQAVNMDPMPVLQQNFSPAGQSTIMKHFS